MLTVKKTTFYDFFTKGDFVIPAYQRGYVWQKNEWDDFYNDIKNIVELKEYQVTHFMGNILIKKNSAGNYEIIDGQQRLITILLFIKAFEEVYRQIRPLLNKKYIPTIFGHTLHVNDSDNVFSAILNNPNYSNRTTTNDISERIQKAFFEFKTKINNQGNPIFKRTITTDENLYRLLKRLIFIEIEIDAKHNPYLIFETLNARGVELNISDLVKNHLIEHSTNQIHTNNEWNRITSGLNNNEFERVFQFFYNSSNNKKRLLKEITATINNQITVNDFLQKLSVYTDNYKQLSDITQTYQVGDVQKYISYLNHLGTDSYKILAIPAKSKFTPDEFLKVLKLCEVLIFRYVVIGKKDEKVLIKKMYEIAQKISLNTLTTANAIYNILHKDFFVDDEEFENAFSYIRLTYSKRQEYRYNNQGTLVKYILYRIENYLRGDLQLSLIGTQTNDVSIEHIENESSTNLSNEHKYRLGNYALMREADNNAMGQNGLTFIQKRTSTYYLNSQYLTLIGGNANGKTLSAASSYNLMDEGNIKNRQRQLAKIAVDLWSLDGRQFVLGVN